MGFVIMIAVLAIICIAVSIVSTKYFSSLKVGMTMFFFAVLVSGVLVFTNGIQAYTDDHWVSCHVTGKDRGASNGSYRVYTSDCGVLANKDEWLRGKFNSADIWQLIPDEGNVSVHVVGIRNGLISWFPNILEVRPVS